MNSEVLDRGAAELFLVLRLHTIEGRKLQVKEKCRRKNIYETNNDFYHKFQ
jgi:hypothetical protein